MPNSRETGDIGRSHTVSFDHRRLPEMLRTAIATAFFCPPRMTSFAHVAAERPQLDEPKMMRISGVTATKHASVGASAFTSLSASAPAQLDLCRICHTRHNLLSEKLSDPGYESRASLRRKAAFVRSLLRGDFPDADDSAVDYITSRPEEPHIEARRTTKVCLDSVAGRETASGDRPLRTTCPVKTQDRHSRPR